MNSENSIRKIFTDIIGPNVGKGEAVLCVLCLTAIIFMAVDHRYDINVKVGPVDIALTQKMIDLEEKMKKLSEYDWYCDDCHEYLNDQSGFDAYCGYWTCSNCGNSNKIGKSEIIFDNHENFSYDDEDEEIPVGCRACGGPYPNCMTSCKLFDN